MRYRQRSQSISDFAHELNGPVGDEQQSQLLQCDESSANDDLPETAEENPEKREWDELTTVHDYHEEDHDHAQDHHHYQNNDDDNNHDKNHNNQDHKSPHIKDPNAEVFKNVKHNNYNNHVHDHHDRDSLADANHFCYDLKPYQVAGYHKHYFYTYELKSH
ncbi:hypothetical protein HK102_007840 [Quaeritorhiza haematococci]|nr:hypothetical protein HK102_007840 [Quaeritorhiza haematococci]